MPSRFVVAGPCATGCGSCHACRPVVAPAPEVLDAGAGDGPVDLGGGDATRWPGLWTFLALSSNTPQRRVSVEAPGASLTRETLERLARAGCHGVVVQMERSEEEQVIAEAEALGLDVRLRCVARPETLVELGQVVRRARPREAVLELTSQTWTALAQLEAVLLAAPNLSFSATRRQEGGYLPPCTLTGLWRVRPRAFQRTLRARAGEPNRALRACARCALAERCQWHELTLLEPDLCSLADPLANAADLLSPPRPTRSRPDPERPLSCTAPWTTMELSQPDGKVRQCCATWTHGSRGDASVSGLLEIWNGEGYRFARRELATEDGARLCRAACPRRFDRRFDERHLRIGPGGESFVRNQELLGEDVTERRERVRGFPLHLALCPSTYCNFDCVMCVHGRTPRRDLPDTALAELPELLPFLRTLTVLGGEPFAHPRTWDLLAHAELSRCPELRIDIVTNGSLLTEAALTRLDGSALGHVTVSLNAGTATTHARIQRGAPLEQVLDNLDALLRFRARQPRWFGVSLSFVVQRDNADDLLPFAALADERNLDIRLLPLSPDGIPELDFFVEPAAVARVVERLDELAARARCTRPDWCDEIRAVREATLTAAAARQGRLEER